MAWKVDFRNHLDSLCRRICNDLADLVLCVPHSFSIWCAVICLALGKMADEGLFPYRSELGEFRIFLYLDSPALVVCEVPVERVELVNLHHVEVLLHHVHVEEMSRNIQMHSSVAEAWGIVYLCALECPFLAFCHSLAEDFHRKHLLEGLHGIVESVE